MMFIYFNEVPSLHPNNNAILSYYHYYIDCRTKSRLVSVTHTPSGILNYTSVVYVLALPG